MEWWVHLLELRPACRTQLSCVSIWSKIRSCHISYEVFHRVEYWRKTICTIVRFSFIQTVRSSSYHERSNFIDLMQIWRLLISINWISSIKEMNPVTRKSMSKCSHILFAVWYRNIKWSGRGMPHRIPSLTGRQTRNRERKQRSVAREHRDGDPRGAPSPPLDGPSILLQDIPASWLLTEWAVARPERRP